MSANKVDFFLFDSLDKRAKQVTFPVKMYVCGPTVYDNCHIGHGRSAIVFDCLRRILETKGPVTYCSNITDINEKIYTKAKKNNQTEKEVAEYFIQRMQEDYSLLNVLQPDIQPKVSDHLVEIAEFIQTLLDKSIAYYTSSTIYYDTKAISSYGYFTRLEQNKLQTRIKDDPEKRNAQDFALWKLDNSGYSSSLGKGFPGWHIECSAMSYKHLGEHFTIHGGGTDLQFPHHENEIAQSLGRFNTIPANIWFYNEMVHWNQDKMSKSLGNCIFLKDLVKNKFDGDCLRYIYLSFSADSVINFNTELWNKAKRQLLKWRQFYFSQTNQPSIASNIDNFDTPYLIRTINNFYKRKQWGCFKYLVDILGFAMQPVDQNIISDLLYQRSQAKINKNYILSDDLRNQLEDLGYIVHD